MDAVTWGYENDLTMHSTLSAFNPNGLITRAQIAKFMVAGADALGLSMDSDQECNFTDLNSADQSLVSYIEDACAMGLVKAQITYRPNANVTRTELEILFARMAFGGMDAVLAYADDNNITESAAAREMLMDGGVITQNVVGSTLTQRIRPMLMLYRMQDMDITPSDCIEGVDCPVLPGTGDTGQVVEVKNGNLELSLATGTPTNGSSIPSVATVNFATVNFASSNSDVTVRSVTLKREGLGQVGGISRVYFERNGIRVSGRASLTSDGTTIVSFSPVLVVKANSSETLDLVASVADSA